MGSVALLFMGIRMVSCVVRLQERISIPRKALIESVLEFELNSVPAIPPKSIAEVCTGTGHYYYTSDAPSESSLLGEVSSSDSSKWIAPIHLNEDDQRLYWYIWQRNNEQCVTSGHLFKYGLSTYWDNIYIHSTQMKNGRPRLAPSHNNDNLNSLSKSEIGVELIDIGLKITLSISVMTLLSVFLFRLYSWCVPLCRTGIKPDAHYNTKEVTWVCRCGAVIQDRVSERVPGAAASCGGKLYTHSLDHIARKSARWVRVSEYWYLPALGIAIYLDTLTQDLIRMWFDRVLIIPLEDVTRSPLVLVGWILRVLVAVSCFLPAVKLEQLSYRRHDTLMMLAAGEDASQSTYGDGTRLSAYSVDTESLSQESDAHTAVGKETSRGSKETSASFGRSLKKGHGKSSHEDTSSSTHTSQINVLIVPQPESLYLLLCIPQYKYATKVVHMDVAALTSDQQLFASLRTHYTTMRGRLRMLLSLKKLRSIDFVQFEAYRSDLVDVKKENDIPPESKSDEYRYRPMPADVIPPVGRNHMMHLYEHPDHAEDVGICLDRIPKKLKERLAICPNRGTRVGWGVHFSEGLNWLLLYILGLLGLSLGILFGVLWAKFKGDLQGGFGIAACIMLGFTFTVGIVQAAFEQK